jgi:Lar family restriction alleviation protein
VKLKPCPFCGGRPSKHDFTGSRWIECAECGATSRACAKMNGAIRAWNRRAKSEGESDE